MRATLGGAFPFLAVILGGGLAGSAAKLADETAWTNDVGLNDLGTYLGLWVVLVTLVAVWSPTRRQGVLRVVLFLLAMVLAYYATSVLVFGFTSLRFLVAWSAIAVTLAPVFAALVWPARQHGWHAAFAVALAAGLLLAEAYGLRLNLLLHVTQFGFDLLAAGVLVATLPPTWEQRWRALVLVPIVGVAAHLGWTQIVPELLGLLQQLRLLP